MASFLDTLAGRGWCAGALVRWCDATTNVLIDPDGSSQKIAEGAMGWYWPRIEPAPRRGSIGGAERPGGQYRLVWKAAAIGRSDHSVDLPAGR